MFWHINNHRLVTADAQGYMKVHQLGNHNILDAKGGCSLSQISPDLKPIDIVGLWILENGDILVQTYSKRDTTSTSSSATPEPAANPGLLTRLKPHVFGYVVWKLSDQSNLCGSACTHDSSKGDAHAKPIYAVGKTQIYEMRHERHDESQNFYWVSTLIVRPLDRPFQEGTIQRYQHPNRENWNDCRMTLTGDEKYLILKNRNGVVRILSTVDGVIQIIGGGFPTRASVKIVTSCLVDMSSSGFFEYRSWPLSSPGRFACSLRKYDYDVPSDSFVRKEIYTTHKPMSDLDEVHDWDRGITICSERDGEYLTFRVRETRDYQPKYGAMSPCVRDLRAEMSEGGRKERFRMRSPVKLQDLPHAGFQSSAPVSCLDSFMGMVDGYFVNFESTSGTLGVFGFWPFW